MPPPRNQHHNGVVVLVIGVDIGRMENGLKKLTLLPPLRTLLMKMLRYSVGPKKILHRFHCLNYNHMILPNNHHPLLNYQENSSHKKDGPPKPVTTKRSLGTIPIGNGMPIKNVLHLSICNLVNWIVWYLHSFK